MEESGGRAAARSLCWTLSIKPLLRHDVGWGRNPLRSIALEPAACLRIEKVAHLLSGTAARSAGLDHPSISLTRELVPLAERMMYPPIRPLLMVTLSPLLKGNVLGVDCIQIWPLANRNIMRCLDPDRIATISVSTSGWLFQSNNPPRDNFFLASCLDSSATITLLTGSAARTAWIAMPLPRIAALSMAQCHWEIRDRNTPVARLCQRFASIGMFAPHNYLR